MNSFKMVKFFKNTCSTCYNDIVIPLLGDSYGELLLQSKDGTSFYVGEFISTGIFHEVDSLKKDLLKSSVNTEQIETILLLRAIADKVNNQEYSLMYPICPNCRNTLHFYTDQQEAGIKELSFLHWNNFKSKSPEEKRTTLAALIEKLLSRNAF